MRANQGFSCGYESRELNGVADKLGKLGRIDGWDHIGYRSPMFGTFL